MFTIKKKSLSGRAAERVERERIALQVHVSSHRCVNLSFRSCLNEADVQICLCLAQVPDEILLTGKQDPSCISRPVILGNLQELQNSRIHLNVIYNKVFIAGSLESTNTSILAARTLS